MDKSIFDELHKLISEGARKLYSDEDIEKMTTDEKSELVLSLMEKYKNDGMINLI